MSTPAIKGLKTLLVIMPALANEEYVPPEGDAEDNVNVSPSTHSSTGLEKVRIGLAKIRIVS